MEYDICNNIELLSDAQLDYMLDNSEVNATDQVYTPPRIISINNTPICTLGGISVSTGKAKSKKTFHVSMIAASAISGHPVLNYSAHLPEDKCCVLYIDTEQIQCECHSVVTRILNLAGMPSDSKCDKLKYLRMRDYSQKLRVRLIERALKRNQNFGLVIIDGIRDLMVDINNISESVNLINTLTQWSERFNVHIHCVLHLNKGDDNIRGHIGTEISNKAETVMLVQKSKTSPDISEVRAMHVRFKEFSPFAFRINASGLPEVVSNYTLKPIESSISSKKPEELTTDEHMEALTFVFKKPIITGYENMMRAMIEGYSSIGYTRARTTMSKALSILERKKLVVKGKGQTYSRPDKTDKQIK